MYTFDVSEEEATATYHEVCTAYENIFSTLDLPVAKGMIYVCSRKSTYDVHVLFYSGC